MEVPAGAIHDPPEQPPIKVNKVNQQDRVGMQIPEKIIHPDQLKVVANE